MRGSPSPTVTIASVNGGLETAICSITTAALALGAAWAAVSMVELMTLNISDMQ